MKIITNIDVLKSYTMRYYFKYFPSNTRLENKLLEKTEGNQLLVDEVLEYMKDFLEEDKIIEAKIKNYIFKNKSIYYIHGKLWEKLFPKDRVVHYLEKTYPIESQYTVLEHQYNRIVDNYPKQKVIEKLLAKGFSYNLIQKLYEK